MDMKRFFLYVIAIAALALAGCGGGGGGVGPVVDNGNGNGNGNGDETCPAGTMDNYPDCTPISTTPPTCLEDPMAADCTGASQAQLTKAAGTKTKAIMTEAGQDDDATLGGSARDNQDTTQGAVDDDPYTLEISRDRDGTTIKITDPALADPKFALHMDLGGGTTMHRRAMEADSDGNVEDEIVMVTTDIADAQGHGVRDGDRSGSERERARSPSCGD